ncbi:hypothetical protein CSA80_05015 [Candidatus Saccharibacteria bacterium]|nr:MAG: hypothetical protein CSA80_05015 [Candidatus Saccharibacteria bacterium]
MKRIFPPLFALYSAICLYALLQQHMAATVLGRMVLCWSASVLVMSLLFFVGKRLGRYDVVDVGWGLSIMAISLTAFLAHDASVLRWSPQTLTLLLVFVWGSRLAWHIAKRIRRTNREDERYVALRKNWHGSIARNTYVRIYLLQSFLALLVSVPVVHIQFAESVTWSLWVFVGCVLWMFGFAVEVIADRQLAAFLARPHATDAFCQNGLWKHARYPNYFGELTMWWGIAVIALGTSYGWVGFGGAAVISYLIVYVSGMPPKEARLRQRENWESYKQSTRALFPLPK